MTDITEAQWRALKNLVGALDDLITESGGVYGLHLNNADAPWESLVRGGHYEEWLRTLDEARDALAAPPGDALARLAELAAVAEAVGWQPAGSPLGAQHRVEVYFMTNNEAEAFGKAVLARKDALAAVHRRETP